jgi:DNA-binding GntR family transcriptional regulator
MHYKDSQSKQAYTIIKQKIVNQTLKQGDQIVEQELANELEMSRTPIREAIRMMEADGLIEVIPRKGAYVKIFLVKDLIKLYEIAEALEGMVAFLVAEKYAQKNLSDSTITSLNHSVELMEQLEKHLDYRSWVEEDEHFHSILYESSGNPYIIESIPRIRTQLNITLFNTIPTFIDVVKSNQEHKEILSAILDGDCEQARICNQKQHRRVRDLLVDYYRT